MRLEHRPTLLRGSPTPLTDREWAELITQKGIKVGIVNKSIETPSEKETAFYDLIHSQCERNLRLVK
jgi:hypothetical protein